MKNSFKQLFVSLIILSTSCEKNSETELIPVDNSTPYEIVIPPGFPTNLNIPSDNPLSVEGILLGRTLFYDGRLAGRATESKQMSCSSCHKQGNSFVIGLPRPQPLGIDGIQTHHAMLPLINLIWNPGTFGWNGSIPSIEQDILGVITDPSEFNSSYEAVEKAIGEVPGYRELFKKAFGTEEVNIERVSKAIAQFVRTLISANSKFDKYLRGEIQLSTDELNGFVLFTTEEGADCFHCHGSSGNPLFTTHLFYNNGKDSVFADPLDRYSVTGDPLNKGAYKATTLRNIEFRTPFMHDGRYNTLEEVIDFYSHGLVWSPYIDPLMHHISTGGTQLTAIEKNQLKAFLLTLSDTTFINNPEFGPPDTFPQ